MPTYEPVSTDTCIEWDGTIGNNGYGLLRGELIHRVVYAEVHGAIPSGLLVCHKCDNQPCINIDHLFLGTYTDNLHDAIEKKRWISPMTGYRRTVCFSGKHKMTPENTYTHENAKRGRPSRRCKACRQASLTARMARRKVG